MSAEKAIVEKAVAEKPTFGHIVNNFLLGVTSIATVLGLIVAYLTYIKPEQTIRFIENARQLPGPTPYPTYTLYPTYTSNPTNTPYPTYTPNPTYAPYPTYTPIPTHTIPPEPTNTIEPTSTPTPNILLPFMDTFDHQLRPEWTVKSGTPIVLGGKIVSSSDGELKLALGDSSLTDITISFDYQACGSQFGVFIADKFQFFYRDLVPGYMWWYYHQDNSWNELPGSHFYIACEGNLKIIKKGNQYAVKANDDLKLEANFGEQVAGSVDLILGKNTSIDNFSITQE